MRRFTCLLLVLMFASTFTFADAKKAKEKIKKAEADFQRQNFNGAEKNLLDAIKEDPDSIGAHDALAGLYSQTGRYSFAAREYSSALAIDGRLHQLTAEQRRHLVDGQGVSYALSGNLDRAQEIYLAALAKDPDYALYNYNLACVYAERHDLDTALSYLKKSWEHRDTLPAGMSFPDPRKDSSFKPYLDDPKFQEAVRHIVL
jgi:Tfp pilus assembly protein PilF